MTSTIQIPVTLRPSRAKIAGFFFLSLLFVLGGIWMVRDGESAGYFVAGFFGLGLLVFPLQFLPNGSYLRLAPEGFTICSLFRTHTVPWAHVQEFAVTRISFSSTMAVAWNHTPEHRPGRRARAIARFCSGYEGTLPDTFGMKPHDLAALMEHLRQQYADPSL